MTSKPVICLMGPTASGKTGCALELAGRLALDVVSVDSALVYRGMDIGTAKPSADVLQRVPHRLVDILDPEESYSAGDFVRDARREIDAIHRSGRVPLLVGGTMLYFRALTTGLAKLPEADQEIRARIDAEAAIAGWPAMHRRLQDTDPLAAARINENDSQRIQRALEVFEVSGRTLTDWHAAANVQEHGYAFLKIALVPGDRARLHRRIATRLQGMLAAGFVGEVRRLMARPALTRNHASMRAVGYRQLWAHVCGERSLEEAGDKALAATRQLCKRQLTWLRSENELNVFDPLENGSVAAILALLQRHVMD
jgi:tRNA dimethylallyltransferase